MSKLDELAQEELLFPLTLWRIFREREPYRSKVGTLSLYDEEWGGDPVYLGMATRRRAR